MATPPLGTLIWGDGILEFISPAGTIVPPPTSNPDAGSEVNGIISLSNAKVVVINGGAPNFPTTADGVFAADFLSSVEFDVASGAIWPTLSVYRDENDFIYSVNTNRIFKYDEDGNVVQVFVLPATNTTNIAVNKEGTIAYYVRNTSEDTVRKWDLAGDTDLGVFITLGGAQAQKNSALFVSEAGDVFVGWRVAGNDFVRRYDSSAAFIQDYTPANQRAGNSFLGITPGYTADTFWVNYYISPATTWSEVRTVEYDIATGSILNSFEPEDGFYNFDTPFCVYGIDPGIIPLTYLWTKVSGPGTVTFSDATILDPTVSFSAAGVYVLRLSVTSECQVMSDDVTITILGGDSGNCVLPSPDPTFDCE